MIALQIAFKDAYSAWEGCSEYQFGPMLDLSLTTHFTNSFPTDTAVINSNIAGASYTLDGLANFAAQGFPALDYLLFGVDNNSALARFTTAPNAAGARNYLAALTGALKTKTAAVANAWSPAGSNYLDRFSKATGVDAGSSLSQLLNAFVQDFDVTLQNYKIGIPIGKYGPNTLPIAPEKVEGYYAGNSVALLIAQLQAIQNIYLGGLDKKVAATTATNNGMPLNDAIKNQINALMAKLQALPDPLSGDIKNDITAVNDTYTEVRKLTVLFKADMSSALGVKISFQDDDGD
jgi:predicted lipoprotein